CLIVFAVAVAVVSALDFHRVLPTPTGQLPRPLLPTGKLATVDPKRMYGPGIFQDPNDVCVLIVTALVLVVGRLAGGRSGAARWLWLVAVGVFGYGFYLTQSRGGLLALIVGMGLLIRLRFGWPRAILLGALGLPVLLVMLGARQTAISVDTNTGKE